jgi:hypothetical protein
LDIRDSLIIEFEVAGKLLKRRVDDRVFDYDLAHADMFLPIEEARVKGGVKTGQAAPETPVILPAEYNETCTIQCYTVVSFRQGCVTRFSLPC